MSSATFLIIIHLFIGAFHSTQGHCTKLQTQIMTNHIKQIQDSMEIILHLWLVFLGKNHKPVFISITLLTMYIIKKQLRNVKCISNDQARSESEESMKHHEGKSLRGERLKGKPTLSSVKRNPSTSVRFISTQQSLDQVINRSAMEI